MYENNMNFSAPVYGGMPYGAPQQMMQPPYGQAAPMWQPQPNYCDPRTVYGYPQGSGVVINPCNVRGVSTTSKEDDELLKNSGARNFQITALDMAKARCNHKDQNGNIKVEVLDADNLCRCTKCGKEFHLIKPSKEVVQQLVNMFLDLFQSVKVMWLTPPKEFAEQVYTIQCLIEQVPEMYEAAQRDWAATEKAINNQIQPAYAGGYYANGLNSIPTIQQGFYGAPTYQQPMPGQPQMMPQGQPGYQFVQPGQPMNNGYYNQVMQQPMPVGGNMMRSEFVQGGVVPMAPTPQQGVPVNQAIPNFMQMQQPMPGQPQQTPVMSSVPQPGQPQQQNNLSMAPPQQPTQVSTAQNSGTSTTTTSVSL